MTLAAFLLDRYDAEQATAEDVRHQQRAGRPLLQIVAGGTGVRELADPERWLADIAAKRRIVEWHPTDDAGYCGDGIGLVGCQWLSPCPTLRYLAAPYASHPEFDPGWLA